MAGTGFIDIWVNCPDETVAGSIARESVARRLAACANVLAPIASVYRWRGNVETGSEVPLILKTRTGHFDAVATLVRKLHPFEVPSIVATPIVAVDGDYGAWIEQETENEG